MQLPACDHKWTSRAVHVILTLSEHFLSAKSPLQHFNDVAALGIIVLITAFSGFLLLAMVQFTVFHIRLVATVRKKQWLPPLMLPQNLTTIENLDYNARESSKYDLGAHKNCQQVW